MNKMAAAVPRLSHSRCAKNQSDNILIQILTSLLVSEESYVYFYGGGSGGGGGGSSSSSSSSVGRVAQSV